jgi:aspartyl-tRNA synthetase
MSRRESVRDVIAFPKDKLGNDLLVNSPSRLTSRQLFDYHIKIRSEKEVNEENEARDKIFNLGVNRLLETLKGVQWMKASDNLLYPVSKDNENPDRPCHAEEISRVLNQLDSKVKGLRPQGAEITAEDLDWRTEYPAEVKRTKQVLEQMDSLMEKLEHIKEGCIASVETRTELKEILSFVEFLELRFQILQKWPYPELLSDIENVIRDVSRILTGDE